MYAARRLLTRETCLHAIAAAPSLPPVCARKNERSSWRGPCRRRRAAGLRQRPRPGGAAGCAAERAPAHAVGYAPSWGRRPDALPLLARRADEPDGQSPRAAQKSSRRSTPWRELTSYFLLRPRGASLLAQTGRSEQGDVRSQSRWPRLDPPPPPFHRTHGLRRTTCGMAAASRGSHDRGRVKLSRTASKPA